VSKSGVAVPVRDADVMRFWARVVVTSSCWVRVGAVGSSDGYGRFAVRVGGRQRTVTPHQVAAQLACGPVPARATVLHGCDVQLCVRPPRGHVEIGTQRDNMRHAVWRQRARGPRPGWADVRGAVGESVAIRAGLLSAWQAGVAPAYVANSGAITARRSPAARTTASASAAQQDLGSGRHPPVGCPPGPRTPSDR
jgi:hypothetical protein